MNAGFGLNWGGVVLFYGMSDSSVTIFQRFCDWCRFWNDDSIAYFANDNPHGQSTSARNQHLAHTSNWHVLHRFPQELEVGNGLVEADNKKRRTSCSIRA